MKNNLAITLALLAAITFVVSGCDKQKQEKNLQQHYAVKFSDGVATATANFTTSETSPKPVTLDRVNRIKANGSEVNVNTLAASNVYGWNLDSVPEVRFTLELNDKTLTNTVNQSALSNSQLLVDSVYYISDTVDVKWTGDPVTAGEIVSFSIDRVYDTANLYNNLESGYYINTRFVFDPVQTKTFAPGMYTITMGRVKTLPLQQGDNGAGGEIAVGVYTSKTVRLQ